MLKKCKVCKKEFEMNSHNQLYCGVNCKKQYYNFKNAGKYKKRIILKRCELCNEKFEGYSFQKFCKREHVRNCVVCNEEFIVKVLSRPAKVCSQKCVGIYSKNDYKNNDYENSEKLKFKRTCAFCNEEFFTNNSRKKYCNKKHFLKCEICEEKFEAKSTYEKYCNKQHYKPCEVCGEPFSIKQNHRPGRVCSFKCVAHYVSSKQRPKEKVKRVLTRDPEKLKHWRNLRCFLKNKQWTNLDLAEYFGTNTSHVGVHIKREGVEGLVVKNNRYTKPEEEVRDILLDFNLVENVDFFPHFRQLIKPMEVDFYIPSLNLAIEVSPTFTHSTKPSFLKEDGVKKDYHKLKQKLCEREGGFFNNSI